MLRSVITVLYIRATSYRLIRTLILFLLYVLNTPCYIGPTLLCYFLPVGNIYIMLINSRELYCNMIIAYKGFNCVVRSST